MNSHIMFIRQCAEGLQHARAVPFVWLESPEPVDLQPVIIAAPELHESIGILRFAEAVVEILDAVGDAREPLQQCIDLPARSGRGVGSRAIGE